MTTTIEKVVKIILDKNEIHTIINSFKNKKQIIIDNYKIPRSDTTNLIQRRGAVCSCCKSEVMMAIIHLTNNNIPGITFFCSSDITNGQLTTDHILPRRLGGTNHLKNLQVMCYGCNVNKQQLYQPNTFINKDFLLYESYIKVLFRIYGSEIITEQPQYISSDKVVKLKKILYNILKDDNKIIPNFDVETFNESFAYVVKYAHIIFD